MFDVSYTDDDVTIKMSDDVRSNILELVKKSDHMQELTEFDMEVLSNSTWTLHDDMFCWLTTLLGQHDEFTHEYLACSVVLHTLYDITEN